MTLLTPEEIAPVKADLDSALAALDAMLLGRPALHRLVLAGILARGHILLEGLPGLGKTALVTALAKILELDRILAREDEEGVGERTRHAHQCDGPLLHRLEKGGLRLRRGAVDLVSEKKVAEHWPRTKRHVARAVGLRLEDVRADDVGRHKVGGELYALCVELENLRERRH